MVCGSSAEGLNLRKSSAEATQGGPGEKPLEYSGPWRCARREFEKRNASFAQRDSRVPCPGHEPRHEQTEQRLVSDDRDDLGRRMLTQPVSERSWIAARDERIYCMNGEIAVCPGNDFCGLLRSEQRARSNYIDGFNERFEPGCNLFHLFLTSLGQGATRVVAAGSGFLRRTVPDH